MIFISTIFQREEEIVAVDGNFDDLKDDGTQLLDIRCNQKSLCVVDFHKKKSITNLSFSFSPAGKVPFR